MGTPTQMDIKVEYEEYLYEDPLNSQDTKDCAKDYYSISEISTNRFDFDDSVDDDEENECALCDKVFQSKKLFKAHVKQHGKLANTGLFSDEEGEEEELQTIEKLENENMDVQSNASSKEKSVKSFKKKSSQQRDMGTSERLAKIEKKLQFVINNQNKILEYLERLTPNDLPVQTFFPVCTTEEILKVDEASKMDTTKISSLLRNILHPNGLIANLKKILSEAVLMEYNYDGVNGKKSFKALKNLNKALLEACTKEGYTSEDYIREIRTAFRVNKNRLFKKKYDSRRKERQKLKDATDTDDKGTNMSLDPPLE